MSEPVVRVGMLGCGTVGAAAARMLAANARRHRGAHRRRIGHAGRRPRPRADARRAAAREAFTVDGGRSSTTRDRRRRRGPRRHRAGEAAAAPALANGKRVVTANKELIANEGRELFEAADAAGLDLLFEASVAGGVPIIRPLKDSLAGEAVRRVTGIVNGTTNYVLTQMSEHGWGFDDALAEAQRTRLRRGRSHGRRRGLRRGRQVRDPRVDRVRRPGRGGRRLPRGDRRITAQDIADATRLGYVVKLLAIAELRARSLGPRAPGDDPGGAPARQRARRVQRGVRRRGAGRQLMFYGRGAGGDRAPRASWATWCWRRVTWPWAAGRPAARACATAPSSRWPRRRASTTSTSTWRTGPACSPRSRLLRAHDVSIERVWQEGPATRRRSCSSPTVPGGRLPGHARGPAGDGRRARRGEPPARGGGGGVSGGCPAPPWRGVIEEYRGRLPVAEGDPGRLARRRRHAPRAVAGRSRTRPGARSG